MASLLFDDITFPRELYDPDTFEFVAPVSTLLAFTPHILSQLGKSSESEQVPLPFPPGTQDSKGQDETKSKDRQVKDEPTTSQQHQRQPPAPQDTSRPSSGLFSTLQSLASSTGTQRILENGLYFAGRYMDGKASSSSHREYHRRDERNRSSWFGQNTNYHREQQERERLREMEQRLQQMERDMRHNSAMARTEIEAQRRERYKLEQELEAQKQRVKTLETEMKEERRQEAERERTRKQREEEERRKAAAQKAKSRSDDGDRNGTDHDGKEGEKSALLTKSDADASTSLTGSPVLLATVGVASLAVSLYSAHKASSSYSVVSFHDQLEQLMAQCESVIQSTEAWISEQFLEVPDQVREDIKLIKELMDTIQRLDPRIEKKAESVAWSMSAVGSLGAVGGAVIGSMTAMASGGTIVLGCALYGIVARARYNGPEYKGARAVMELKADRVLRSLGVNPTSAGAGPSTSNGSSRTSLIHESRIERLRLEFESRDGLDIQDADEIDGLVVEEALREASFSAPFVSQKGSVRSAKSRQHSTNGTTKEEPRPSIKMRTEPTMAYGYAS
ncbi:hypothetical protein B0O80DRAFT_453121 [Mortierella sp. GBAus27b]|nr:hypothetical protein BGX31_008077 [Mortierella sp. GBA43]KAI8353123.1 hypothetical protein B0O80DRAFT_453121 [Mortierella sp. GBAus27b]